MSSLLKQLLRRADVLTLTRMSKSKMYADIAKKTFPGPIKHGRMSFWNSSEVSDWIDKRIADRDANTENQATAKRPRKKTSHEIFVSSKQERKAVDVGRLAQKISCGSAPNARSVLKIFPKRIQVLRPKAIPTTAQVREPVSGGQKTDARLR